MFLSTSGTSQGTSASPGKSSSGQKLLTGFILLASHYLATVYLLLFLRFINLLVNCLVVTPFMVQTENIMVLKELNKKFMDMEKLERRRDSLKRKTSVMRMSSVVENQPNRQAEVLQDYNGVFMPNMNFFTSAFLYNDFRDLIRDLWWEDPSRWFKFLISGLEK